MFTLNLLLTIVLLNLSRSFSQSNGELNTQISEKKNITIAFILPQDFIRFRKFQSCITNQIAKINKGNWSFSKHFFIDSYTYAINRNFNDIIETVCTLLNTQSNTAIYINYNDYSNIESLNSRLFLKLASFINIPVMTHIPNAYATNTPRKNELQLVPTHYHQAEAIMSLLDRYEWYKYSLIVTDVSGSAEFVTSAEGFQNLNFLNKTFEILSVIKLKFKKDRMNMTEIKRRFKMISLETRFINKSDETNMIFEAASDLGLTTHEYMWIFTRSVISSHLYSNFKYKNFPVGSFSLWSNTSVDNLCDTTIANSIKLWASALDIYYNSIGKDRMYTVLPHTKCWNSSDVSLMSDVKYHYGKNFHNYLIKSSHKEKEKIPIKFDQKGVLDSVEFKILNLNYKYEWKKIGIWSGKKLTMEDIVWPGERAVPPSGKPTKFHIKIVTLEEQPFVIYKDPMSDGSCPRRSIVVRIASEKTISLNRSNPDHYRCATGFFVDLIIELSESLEFTFEAYEVEDKMWGAVNKLGEWNGIIKDLMDDKADLAMTSVKITTSRVDTIDFSVPFFETGIAIIVSLRPGSVSTTAFLKPYDYLIWVMLLLITVHSVALAIYLLQWLYNRMRRGNKQKSKFAFKSIDRSKFGLYEYKNEKYFTLGKSLWLVWVLLFRAATKAQQPTTFSSRFIVNIWACMCLVFTASYTANLAAFMIIKEEYPDLKSLLDSRLTNPYAHRPAYRFGTVKSGSTAEIIEKNQPRMYDYMKEFIKDNVTEGIRAVKEKKLDAFLYDAIILEYRAGLDVDCKLRVVGSWYSMTGYGIALAKKSKYKEMIDRKIIEYIYSGQMERSQRFWFSGSCNKQREENNTDGLGFLQISSVFLLLVSGIGIGILLFLLDHLWIRYFNKSKIKKTYFDNRKFRKEIKHESLIKNMESESFFSYNSPQVIKEFDYQIQKTDCSCANPECEKIRKRLEYYRGASEHDSSFQHQELVVFSSPEKSNQTSFYNYDDCNKEDLEYKYKSEFKYDLDNKNSVILGTNSNEMADLNFISSNSFKQLDCSDLKYQNKNTTPRNNTKEKNNLTLNSYTNLNPHTVVKYDNRANALNNDSNYDYINVFNKKRHELETSI